MIRITAFVEQHQGCPLYSMGSALEFNGVRVEGVKGAPICQVAIQNIAKAPKRIAEKGEAPEMHAATFCGGCRDGKAWFSFRKSASPDTARMTERFSRVVYSALSTMKIFAGVPDEQLRKIVPLLTERKVEAGEVIIQSGEPGRAFYVIVSGKFDVVSGDDQGGETQLATLAMGECFGEMSLLSGDPVSATIRSSTEGTLLALEKTDFEKMLVMIPSLSMTLARVLAQRLAKVSGKIVDELRSGMVGRLDQIPPSDLVQAMNVNGMTGMLIVNKEGGEITLYFMDGQVQQAEFGAVHNEDAFYEFLTWAKGNFRFKPLEENTTVSPKINKDTIGLLMEGMRRIDETKRYSKSEQPE